MSLRANDRDDNLTNVQLFANGSPLVAFTAAPWEFNWTNVQPGTYALTALATDDLGLTTTSRTVTITITGVQPPAEKKLYYIHVDHLNTPRLIANASQQAVWRHDQAEPFGDNPPDENPSGLGAFEFPVNMEGRTYLDKETNLLYNTNRYRDTSVGRFPQADPLGLKGGDLSLYVLTRNNPLTFTDPLGLTVWLCNRQVVWYLGGVGNHSYFWNDQNKQCCGRDQGKDPLGNCKERGPGGDACVPVTGSQGKEDVIMDCCQQTANQGTFLPPKNDCHTSVDRCLKDVGLPNPGAPGGRMGSCSSCWLSDTLPPSINYTAP